MSLVGILPEHGLFERYYTADYNAIYYLRQLSFLPTHC